MPKLSKAKQEWADSTFRMFSAKPKAATDWKRDIGVWAFAMGICVVMTVFWFFIYPRF